MGGKPCLVILEPLNCMKLMAVFLFNFCDANLLLLSSKSFISSLGTNRQTFEMLHYSYLEDICGV